MNNNKKIIILNIMESGQLNGAADWVWGMFQNQNNPRASYDGYTE